MTTPVLKAKTPTPKAKTPASKKAVRIAAESPNQTPAKATVKPKTPKAKTPKATTPKAKTPKAKTAEAKTPVAKKTPKAKTWADIVKKGAAKPSAASAVLVSRALKISKGTKAKFVSSKSKTPKASNLIILVFNLSDSVNILVSTQLLKVVVCV